MSILYKIISTKHGQRTAVVSQKNIVSYDEALLISEMYLDSGKYKAVKIEEYDPDRYRLGRDPDLH